MKSAIRLLLGCALFGVLGAVMVARLGVSWAAEQAPAAAAVQQSPARVEFGLEKRTPWTTSKITGSPEPPSPYITERVFPNVQFNNPVDFAEVPGSDRLFVVQLDGKVFSFPNRADATTDLSIDLKRELKGVRELYGITFHPDFAKNRYVYLCYTLAADTEDGTHLSRFTVTNSDPPKIEAASEQILLKWWSGGHNGGCLKFGPDGYLYVTTGDGASPNPPDVKKTGQDISDLLSSILRIDVNNTDGSKPYKVPADNPFVSTAGARPEVWAYGFRNPWKMCFDPKTGDLWAGDVGWELWELLYRVERGGNYGWSIMEGRQPVNQEFTRGPTPILPPIVDHPHSEGASITGGYFYQNQRLPELVGAYIYGDYSTGKIWALRFDGTKVTWHQELTDTTMAIITFGRDSSGEIYVVDYAGTIHRLIRNPAGDTSKDFPRKLSETGLFTSVAKQELAPGVYPYSISAELWDDGAKADRAVAVPGDANLNFRGRKGGGGGGRRGWSFPKDAVLVKTLTMEMERGNPRSGKRLETQILHYTGNEWKAYSYQWNDEQTDATLVDANGAERVLQLTDSQAPGGRTTQTWRYASRAECLRCHNTWAQSAIAFNPAQLNKDHLYPAGTANQLATLAHIGLVELRGTLETQPKFANPYDPSASLQDRARAYLHVNCAHCHRFGAGSSVLAFFDKDQTLEQTNTIDVRPMQGTFAMHTARVIAPGDPLRSLVYYRMAKLGQGRMPHIGSYQVDAKGLQLVYDWIKSLPATGGEATGTGREEQTATLQKLVTADPKSADSAAGIARLLDNTSGALMLLHGIDDKSLSPALALVVISQGAAHSQPHIRDLFERFLPEDQRIKRLGSVIRPEVVLSATGDASRGRNLYFNTEGVQCKNCHQISGMGTQLGPDLTKIGGKYNRVQLLESILDPSRSIEKQFVTYVLETRSGPVHTGLLVEQTPERIRLKDAANKEIQVPASDVELMVPVQKSLMPDLLLREMSAQQAADLLEFLSTLK